MDGGSTVPVLLGTGKPARDHLYWEFHERGFHQAVRQGDWKLVRQGPAFKTELFSLKDDIGETKDVAATRPDIVAKMEKLFKTSRVENPNFPTNREVPSVPF